MNNRVTIQVGGQKYTISTRENPGYVLGLSREIDLQLTEMLRDNPKLSVIQATVLLLLNYMDNAKKAEDSADHLRSQVTGYATQDVKARLEVEQLRRQLKIAEQDLAELQKKLERREQDLETLKKKLDEDKEQLKMAEA